MTRRDGLVLHGVAAMVTVVVLAPLFMPGYVLSYDMVFVPHQPLLWELVAPSSGLPRAVPQDAVVSVLSLITPGWLLQRLALVGTIYAAALGAGRLLPARRLLTRVVAAVGYSWTPFLAERLLLGQWGLLLAYAALPWLVAAAIGARTERRGALPRLIVAAAISAITPTGGLVAFIVTVALVAGPAIRRTALAAVGAVAVLNLPWVIAAAMTAAGGTSDPDGVAAFAARGENWSGPFGALAGSGGIWNADTTPDSRASALVPLVTLVVLALAALGFGELRRRWPPGAAVRFGWVAAGGFAIALLGIIPPTADAVSWAVAEVPGAGLLRDGHKFLSVYALLITACMALGVERLAARWAEPRAKVVLVAAALLPVALMPDLAFGAAGALRSVSYPADWDRVAGLIEAAPGEVLSLPFSEYRTYDWNGGRTVFDPASRYLPARVLADDTLVVGDLVLEGEDPRAAQVRELVAADAPVARMGTPWVLVQHRAGGSVSEVSLKGLQLVHDGEYLDLYSNPTVGADQSRQSVRRWVIGAVDLLAVALLMTAIWHLRRSPTAW